MPEPLATYLTAIARKYRISEDSAFEILVMTLVLDKPFYEVYSDIWTGGTHDCGIDGVFIDVPSNTLALFQAKNAASLRETEMTAFRSSYENIFAQGNTAGYPMNPKLEAILQEYKDVVRKGTVLEPKLYFAYSGNNIDPANANNEVLSQRFSTSGYPSMSLIDIPALVSRAAALQKTHRDQIDFTFEALETNITPFTDQALFSFYIGDVKAVNFRMTALQLCELMEREIAVNGSVDTLFTENIRGYLKRNKTNKRISETLHDRNESPFFPFMNNGITIIASTLTIPGDPQAGRYNIPVTNPLIVNGLQTSKVIYEVYQEDSTLLENVFITVKVYETRNQEIIDLITEATNTQTAINYRDQMSNKAFNRWARDYFAAYGVKYISKRGESIREPALAEGLSDSVTNETAIKFWYATYHQDPHRAKTSKMGMMEDVFTATKDTHPVFGDLFMGAPDSRIYMELYNAYRIYQFVSGKRLLLESQAGMDYLAHADELASYGVYRELLNAGHLPEFTDANLEAIYTTVQTRIGAIVNYERTRRGNLYSHNNYFKSDGIVQDYLQIETDPTAFVVQPTLL